MPKNNHIAAKKKFGQNFLINSQIIEQIIDIISPKNKNILEIGPGMGALTKHLNKDAKNLTVFEIDQDMINYLVVHKIINLSQIIKGDFLLSNLDNFEHYEIVGNIPYYITSEIIFKIVEYRHLFKRAILMVQDEVANRIVAKINTPEYSKLSVTLQYIANVKKELFVDKKLFYPQPKVDSAIISIEFKGKNELNFTKLMNFFKICFLSRRKKLSWSLKSAYSMSKINAAYKTLNLNELTRIQELSVEKIVALFKELEQ
ncbi:ribosomal RNA small subunit methyltransferase A [Mycoplasmopsis phocirhinis]|uniref:Ribosomal RNA small subunit methyltransferase A n=1 Tax=Mycoplasmopsis phocirhinis TaxID=142650 RepID=A0A4P6MQ70_9BACT|nr:16S rRNA (adenine(1518)-N(6)/adenine(1519)-N(6))-dimethyltransferase RsmA [Mycoplasmopsis phocirhinis]QBF34886.1 ribosomal RNA small subunit methyltransferase A [Mycoplasmopsis phocirhinis]